MAMRIPGDIPCRDTSGVSRGRFVGWVERPSARPRASSDAPCARPDDFRRWRDVGSREGLDPTYPNLLQLYRLEIRRQHDLQHLTIVGIVEHHMLTARRLQPAAAGAHDVGARALDLGFDPALEHVDHLEVDIVEVALGDDLRPARRHEPDHVCQHHAAGGALDAEVAVLGVGAQPVGLEILVPMMAQAEGLLVPRLVTRLVTRLGFGPGGHPPPGSVARARGPRRGLALRLGLGTGSGHELLPYWLAGILLA